MNPPASKSVTAKKGTPVVTEATMMDFDTGEPTDTPYIVPPPLIYRPKPPRPPSKGFLLRQAGARMLDVKNLRESRKGCSEKYFDMIWKTLEPALEAILAREKIVGSMEEMYRGVENIYRFGKAQELAELLTKRLDDYVSTQMKPKVMQEIKDDDIETLRIIGFAWRQWSEQLGLVRLIFLYLDRAYLFHRQSIEDFGIAVFNEHILDTADVSKKVLNGILTLFKQDRQSDGKTSVDHDLLISSMRMISSIGLYYTKFEPLFIETAREYYARLAGRESQVLDLTAYIKECVAQIEKASAKCGEFNLEYSTKRELILVVDAEMIGNYVALLTDKERLRVLLSREDTETLQTLYRLLDRICDPGKALKEGWEAYIVDQGTYIVQDKDRGSEMVQRLLDLRGTLNAIWTGPLKKNETLGFSLRESFSVFINPRKEASIKENPKPAEMIAKYVDQLLRNGIKNIPPVAGVIHTATDDDSALAHRLDLVLDLFRFVQGKDVFEAFYKKDLARRLLLGRSASDDAEQLMLSKLKNECGACFTNNLEAMFKDMNLSRESVASFNSTKVGSEYFRKVELHVNILSQAAWPSYPETPVTIPSAHAQHLEAFAKFYTSKHQGRKLTWRHALSHCVLVADFENGRRELSLSAFQAVVLLAFNEVPGVGTLRYRDLKTATGLSDPELKRTLQSLACGKMRVLLKSPKGRDVFGTDKFQVNAGFTAQQYRVKINQIQLKETKEEIKETHERVEMDRKYETQAAIVRIMKSRRTIKHVELIQQTIEQTKERGNLDVTSIKQNIEKLIEKDYMERGEGDTYLYVA